MSVSMFGRTNAVLLNGLLSALMLSCMVMASPVMAEEELPIPDVPASKQELMQQAADGEVPVPRVRTFVKPNRSLMKASVANTKSGYAFLDENQRKPGVIKLKSGLQYKVIKAGVGVKPTDKDVVKCRYRGTLIDGTVFEQSDPAKPASIQVEPLVPGLKEAIKLMPVGSKWEVYIPAELGFGSVGKPPKVGPDAVIIYELELLGLASSTSVK
jgi:FKBP-type peptidyl-prolyl cis-trans isomerase